MSSWPRRASARRFARSSRPRASRATTLETAVDVITDQRERWIDTMMTEEHGLPPITRSPGKSAMFTFLAFVLCGSVPLLAYLFR